MIAIETNAGQVAAWLARKSTTLRTVQGKAVEEVNREIVSDYERVTHNWDHKPRITQHVERSGGAWIGRVRVSGKVFEAVERGVPGRYIYPVRAQVLAFRRDYRAKTSPGSLTSRSGGSYGDMVFSRGHWWPGIRARHFTEKILRKRRARLVPVFLKAIVRWAREG